MSQMDFSALQQVLCIKCGLCFLSWRTFELYYQNHSDSHFDTDLSVIKPLHTSTITEQGSYWRQSSCLPDACTIGTVNGIFSRYSEIVRNSSVRALLFLKKRMHSYLFWSGSLQSFWRLRFSFPHCPAYEYSVMFFSPEPCSSLFGIRRISGVRCCYSKLLKYLISGSLREDHCYPQARAHNLPVLWLHQAS